MLIELNQHLVIAAITNHTLIIPKMLFVHPEKDDDWSKGAEIKHLLDLSSLAATYSIITYDDYTAQHGKVSISQLYNFYCHTGGCHDPEGELWWIARYSGEADFTNAPFIEVPLHNGVPRCTTADDIKKLVDTMRGGPVIGTSGIPFGLTSDNDNFGCGGLNTDSACCTMMTDVCAKMRFGVLIRDWATEFIGSSFANTSFLGIHIRPYQDDCLQVWAEKPMFKEEDVSKLCTTPTLHITMLSATLQALQDLKLQHVFVASHPSIREPNIIPRMRTIGVHPVFVGFDFVADRLQSSGIMTGGKQGDTSKGKVDGSVVILFLLLVEQEIMERSSVFIGSKHSSITGIVRNTRAARAIDDNDSLIT